MTNAVYQATVRELETLLAPRVVSRSLQEGLQLVEKSPMTITLEDVEKILKAHVYRQLQVTMPVTEAKLRISQLLERLQTAEGDAAADEEVLAQQALSVTELKESLKPFSLFFEWPEVQKLRALLQLLDAEQASGNEADKLVQEARAELRGAQQKLEDELVHQARTLTELETSFEGVQSLGGAKVRRLESYIGQIRSAQEARQLAPAEAERALKILGDLRKLMESSVMVDAQGGAEGALAVDADLEHINVETLAPDVSAKLLQIDLENEQHSLEKFYSDYAHLLGYQNAWAEKLERVRAQLAAGSSIANDLEDVRSGLAQAANEQRNALQKELSGMQEGLRALSGELDLAELRQGLQVTRSVLDTTLPPPEDIQHLRSLYSLAQQRTQELSERRAAGAAAQSERLAAQASSLVALRATLKRYSSRAELAAEWAVLERALSALQEAQNAAQVDEGVLAAARQAQAQVEAAAADQAQVDGEREQAQLRQFLSELEALPADAEGAQQNLRGRLDSLLTQAELGSLGPDLITEAQQQVHAYRQSLQASYRARLDAVQERVRSLGISSLASYLASVSSEINQGNFPNLSDTEAVLKEALEMRRAEQLNEVRSLEQELSGYQSATLPQLDALKTQLQEARAQLERGDIVSDLSEIWRALERAQASLERRAADFAPRLDAALASFERVVKLNSDEVAEAGLILRHLDTQREALERVSTGVRAELEASLSRAEVLLEGLEAQFEATQAVADQLAGSNALDGLFDLFGDSSGGLFGDESSGEPPSETPSETAGETAVSTEGGSRLRSGIEPLEAWVDSFLTISGVHGLMVFNDEGEGVSGQLSAEPTELFKTLIDLLQGAYGIGDELALGASSLLLIETSHVALISTLAGPGYRLVAVISSEEVDELLPRLQTDLSSLRAQLVHT